MAVVFKYPKQEPEPGVFNEFLVKHILVNALGSKGEKLYDVGQTISAGDRRLLWYQNLLKYIATKDDQKLISSLWYKWPLVSMEEFLESAFYLNKKNNLYPEVKKAVIEVDEGGYTESVWTGGIGSGKSTGAHYTIARQKYILASLRTPHRMFNLDPASEILIIFQTITATLAKDRDYRRFRTLIELSPFFQKVFPFDKKIESRMRFPNRIEVVPLSGQETASIGQNIYTGALDEVNYMQIITKSKHRIDGGSYDQAWSLYNSLARRRKTRFVSGGKVFGMICLISSKRYPGQFTDVKEQEAEEEIATKGKSSIYIYDKRAWEVQPPETYEGDSWFHVFSGTDTKSPKILEEEEVDDYKKEYPGKYQVFPIPNIYKPEFLRDINDALREIGGVSKLTSHPFIIQLEALAKSFKPRKSVFSVDQVVFGKIDLMVFKDRFKHREEPRFIHLDLSKNKDCTGLSIGYCSGFKKKIIEGVVEVLPTISIDGSLQIKAPPNGEIDYSRIRGIIYTITKMGVPIKWVSADSYESVDMLQILRKKGYICGVQSMDISPPLPYKSLKQAIYDERLDMPMNSIVDKEFRMLEYDAEKDKVDHPEISLKSGEPPSKDVADSVAGVYYGLATRREIWHRFNIPLHYIPELLKKGIEKDKLKK